MVRITLAPSSPWYTRPAMRPVRSRVPRGALIVLLLGVALVATGSLAWEAHAAAASHRAAAEAVLRDYAMLAAGELVRRATSEVGYQGHYVLVQTLTDPGPDRPRQATNRDPRWRRAAALVRRPFTADANSHAVRFEGEQDAPAAAWLAEHLGSGRGPEPFAVVCGTIAGEQRMFVAAQARQGGMVGYEVNVQALVPFLEAAVDRGPLLPPSLGQGRVGNAALAIAIRDERGREMFRRGTGWSGAFRVRVPCGGAYAGSLQGFTAEVEIDPAAAAELVIGGLPRSRLSLLLALLALAAGLLVAAVVLFRRDRALERLRAEFVASASHELRTPLTQIRMFAETLRLRRVRSDEETRRSLEIIDREVRRLGQLVENLLQFSRAGGGSLILSSEPQEVAPLVAEVAESFQPLADDAGARVTTNLMDGLQARVDAGAFRQLLLNLLDNAVKYGPRGQEVIVSLEQVNGRVRLAVEDEGPGIPPAERERVFERFHRLDRDRASTVTGTGLGLAVVRELTLRLGGSCSIGTGRRGGAMVLVDLPPAGSGPRQ